MSDKKPRVKPIVEKPTSSDGKPLLSLNAVSQRAGLTPQYVRTLIRKGILPSTLVPVAFESKVVRHMISEADLEAFQNRLTQRTKRDDKRNKYVFYATPEEKEQVLQALTVAKLEHLIPFIRTANHLKPGGPNAHINHKG